MVSLDEAIIARLKTHDECFEILVDPDLALKYREGKEVRMEDLLAIDNIFKDAKQGEKASEHVMDKVLGTSNLEEVVDRILKKGDISLTTEQRREMLENRRRQIIAIIARNAINPQTNTPHPPARVEKAMEEAKVNVDVFKSAKEQIESIVKEIRPILPIRFQNIQIAVKIPSQYAGKIHQVLHEFGETKKEEWDKNGNLLSLLEIPAGLKDELYDKLNNLTHGEVETRIVE